MAIGELDNEQEVTLTYTALQFASMRGRQVLRTGLVVVVLGKGVRAKREAAAAKR